MGIQVSRYTTSTLNNEQFSAYIFKNNRNKHLMERFGDSARFVIAVSSQESVIEVYKKKKTDSYELLLQRGFSQRK